MNSKQSRTAKGKKTKDAITESALSHFAEVGLEKVSLNSIARACKVPPSLLLYHFNGTRDIFAAIVRKVVEAGVSTAEGNIETTARAAKENLEAYIDAMFAWIGRNARFQAIMLQFYHQTTVDPEFKALNALIAKKR